MTIPPTLPPGTRIKLIKKLGEHRAGDTAIIGPQGFYSLNKSKRLRYVDVIWDHNVQPYHGGFFPSRFETAED